jgi:hypothetical protein
MIDRQSWGRIGTGTVFRTCPSNLHDLQEGNDKLLTLGDYFVIFMFRPQTAAGDGLARPSPRQRRRDNMRKELSITAISLYSNQKKMMIRLL